MNKLIDDCIKLGFGMMRLPRVEGTNDIDLEHTKRMVDAFIAAGGKYFDTAYIYEGSEEATKAALCDRYPRESYYLADKLNGSDFAAKSEEEAKNEIRVSLERTGAGYIDFYLLHGIDEGNIDNFNRYGIWDYMKKLKADGLIRHYGFSFHSTPEHLDQLLTDHPDVEFVQLQINYADWEDPLICSRRCYDIATRHGKPVIVMEPVKGGKLANPPQPVKDIQQRMENGDSFAFIAAFSGCPWCNLCIAQLNDAALAEDMHVGYLNTRLDPNWTSNIDIDDYDIFVELFGDYLREDDDGILHLYTPHVFFIKDGQVVAEHSSTVEGADPSQGLTEEQSQELIGIYREGFQSIK